jgi:putative ABC transport system substrate-binding protein
LRLSCYLVAPQIMIRCKLRNRYAPVPISAAYRLGTSRVALGLGVDAMKRREFISLIGGAAAAWPLAARTQQQPAMPVVGFLHFGPPGPFANQVAAFHQGLNETGYVEGQNVAIAYRWAEGHYDRLTALADDLVSRKVDVITAIGPPCASAAKHATSTIPIVFTTGNDPIRDGLVASLARPGGNLTGVSILAVELVPKRLELLSELVPQARVFGLLVNPTNGYSEPMIRDAQAAAGAKGVQLKILNASTQTEIDTALANLASLRVDALVIGDDPFFVAQQKQLVALASRYLIPTAYQFREFAAAGGLVSYGPSLAAAIRQAGVYAGKIVKGAKPADLPVVQPTKFELVVNLKTAKALGLDVPPTLLARADEVIE